MLLFMLFLAGELIVLGVTGAELNGERYPLTVVAVVSLVLTCAIGVWTFTRRGDA